MVFQNYALWPHKTVAENVAFGLEEARTPREETRRRVQEALVVVRMQAYAGRSIHQLSGGQQQRVALARALVVRPRCLLLDEPLSNLDAKLRLEMRTGIRDICKQAGLTAIYVTHDQKEALSVADRLAVMDGGRVCQVGTPEAVYRQPASRFVADFVGETNFLEAEVLEVDRARVFAAAGTHRFEAAAEPGTFRPGDKVTLSIRPEAWRLSPPGLHPEAEAGLNSVHGRITEAIYLGELAQYRVMAGGLNGSETPLKLYEINPRGLFPQGACRVTVAPEDVVVLKTEEFHPQINAD
jgi:iron(III) transport system ATP-binding protein